MSPLPTGNIAPALLVPNIALKTVMLPSAILTVTGFAPTANTGASFFTLPVRIVDTVFECTGAVAFDINFDFETNGSTPVNKIVTKDCNNVEALITDQPQWKNNTSTTTGYSIRHVSLEGNGIPTPGQFPVINVWGAIPSAAARFAMNRPPASTTHNLKFRLEIAETADTSIVLASALFELRYIRP